MQSLSQMLCVYFTVYFLMPRLFGKGRYLLFALATIAAIILSSLISAVVDDLYSYFTIGRHIRSYLIKTVSSVVDVTVITGIFIAITIIQNKLKDDLRARRLESERVKAELDFLKAQINPHFLFNTINNIYVLIEEDKKKGSEMLLRFSELLRYQLYECNEGRIAILKELQFIKNFIAMEQLRVGDAVDVSVDIAEEQDFFEIQPFILLPFVENAFKHVSRHDHKRNFISIYAISAGGVFQLTIWNTSSPVQKQKPGGIGLFNVRRRLDLLYPKHYELHIHEEEEIHTVNFKLYVR